MGGVMNRAAAISALLVALAVPAHAQAPAAKDALPPVLTVISPIFGQLVMFKMPSTFVTAFESTKGNNYIREAVPRGESVERWTQMITVTGLAGAAANPSLSPQGLAGSIAGGFKNGCPETFQAKGLGPGKFSKQEAYVAVASCGRIAAAADRHGETALLVVVKGASDYYTIQWAERFSFASAAAAVVIDDEKWKTRLDALSPIRFCAIVPGEKAPFPSCVNVTDEP
jgi:hypothetical protein